MNYISLLQNTVLKTANFASNICQELFNTLVSPILPYIFFLNDKNFSLNGLQIDWDHTSCDPTFVLYQALVLDNHIISFRRMVRSVAVILTLVSAITAEILSKRQTSPG
jgi:hypothetical protein